MPSSTSCALSFLCLTLLLLLPAQGYRGRHGSNKRLFMNGNIDVNCCLRVSNATINKAVIKCDIQESHLFSSCRIDAYILTTQSGKRYCVDPKAKWLPKRLELLEKKGIICQKQ